MHRTYAYGCEFQSSYTERKPAVKTILDNLPSFIIVLEDSSIRQEELLELT